MKFFWRCRDIVTSRFPSKFRSDRIESVTLHAFYILATVVKSWSVNGKKKISKMVQYHNLKWFMFSVQICQLARVLGHVYVEMKMDDNVKDVVCFQLTEKYVVAQITSVSMNFTPNFFICFFSCRV